ncbi:hypothetical protein WJ41_35110 [Burkholderia ubonensis]|uniref:hypothetical protein n=1 Tax=Burkholderia TaxID=32008 RepID=UPI0005365F22|nr:MULTISPECIES: hypothetical protein [Burkholderia]KGW78481.1 hypothetical protein Y046_4776 [Burkholderia pseudomallei MSHR2990]KVH78741.1 hypothetical protein WJ41_35110 [Burkholderia ubonensis]KVT98631.1 hypothetical protein WK61_09380 [Burkholderia ubonensis]
MALTPQQKLANRLRSLNELDDVTVEVSEGLGQITISHRLHHVADFAFKWVDDNHYVGYFVDAGGDHSQAIVALWTPMEAVKFVVLYATLVELRAKREPLV